MRKTIVETLFSLNYKSKLFEKKKILTEKKSVPKVIDKSSVTLSVFSMQITVIRVARVPYCRQLRFSNVSIVGSR